MKIKTEGNKTLYIRIAVMLVLITLLSAACTNKEEENLIPEKTFAVILSEVYLANGLIVVPEVRNVFAGRDTALNYYDIIESHGYTKEQMESTLRYYFSKKPKKLIRIYDQAIGKLSEQESLLLLSPEESSDPKTELWKDKKSYSLPDTIKNGKLYFEYKLMTPGLYFLDFEATVYPDDHTNNPGLTLLTFHADSAGTGKVNYLPAVKYIKDGFPHKYRITIRVYDNTPVVLQTYLYDRENKPDYGDPHADISDISLTLSP